MKIEKEDIFQTKIEGFIENIDIIKQFNCYLDKTEKDVFQNNIYFISSNNEDNIENLILFLKSFFDEENQEPFWSDIVKIQKKTNFIGYNDIWMLL